MSAALRRSGPAGLSADLASRPDDAPAAAVLSSGAGRTKVDFPQRVQQALARRMAPHSALTCKLLAHHLARSEQTIWSWAAGTKTPNGQSLHDLIGFFGAGFANELFAGTGCVVANLEQVRAVRERAERDWREAAWVAAAAVQASRTTE